MEESTTIRSTVIFTDVARKIWLNTLVLSSLSSSDRTLQSWRLYLFLGAAGKGGINKSHEMWKDCGRRDF